MTNLSGRRIICGVVVSVLASVALQLLYGIGRLLGNIGSAVVYAVVYEVDIPVWVLVILGLLAAPTIYRWGRKQIMADPREEYTEDSFFDITWRWKWSGDEIVDLTPYCPLGDTKLQDDIVGIFGETVHLQLKCINCDFAETYEELLLSNLKDEIKLHIDRKARKLEQGEEGE